MAATVARVRVQTADFDLAAETAALREGDWVDLLGPGRGADDVAEAACTNGYEILTALGRRYARSWVG